ncbi:hypothetical protein RHS01_02001 [Rhizoctonia solani]|uniref:Uncharacterized protein n=1 Tax=Rhizoctonia solani TaxID=456999 RepID=A0A8H7IK46_9AGAM|nr:hypothetical protein RHS01_02001 [Rhizoctonia solani]
MQQQIDSLRGYPTQPYPQPRLQHMLRVYPHLVHVFCQAQPPAQQFSVTPQLNNNSSNSNSSSSKQQSQQPGQSTPSSARQPRSFKRLKYQPNDSEGDDSMMNMSVNMNNQMMPSCPSHQSPLWTRNVYMRLRGRRTRWGASRLLCAPTYSASWVLIRTKLCPLACGRSACPEGVIRFVWEKTPKSSPHNGRMKQIVIEDLQRSRHLYPLVPTADFAAPLLDACFDQAFTTLRGKWRIQCGEPGLETKVEAKAKRTRATIGEEVGKYHRHSIQSQSNNSFPEIKPSDGRSRQLAPVYTYYFEPALIPEVMSSESSEDDTDGKKDFQTRGFSWRSQRAQNFYQCLDEEENNGRDRRYVGVELGASVETEAPRPAIRSLPKGRPYDRSFDWRGFHELGDSSGDEGEPVMDEGTMGIVDGVPGMGVGVDYPGEMGGMQGQAQVGPVSQVGHSQQVGQGQPSHVAHLQHVQHVTYGQQSHMG